MKDIKPKKKWGQNFLIDKNICNKIVSSFKLKSTDSVLEIGPGKGAITNLLAQKARKVIGIEIGLIIDIIMKITPNLLRIY